MKRLSIVCALLLVLPWMAIAGLVPDTAQTKCYDDIGTEITCPLPGEPFYGQDAQYITNPQSYTTLGGGIVQDNVTGLMWQQATAPGTYTWEEALSYCEGLSLGGFSDWRLPAIKELSFIRNMDTYNPAIDTDYFPNTVSSYYWSSTSSVGSPDNAWYVYFHGGYMCFNNKSGSHHVRAVRGGQ